ncbi:MAG: hypothetical protein D6784_12780 [Chloroflexi bacterium]|nr:MAG: hypothetical protein D6784_12780 [Chloroflexota bacterium]
MSLVYRLFQVGGVLAPRLPPRMGYAFCRLAGGLVYRLNRTARANVRLNMRRILGPDAPAQVVEAKTRAVFSYLLYNYYDLFRLPALDDQTVNRLTTVTGWENVEAARAEGKGVLMTSAHLGNIEIVLYAMLLRGLAITIPVERISPPDLFDYICRLRTSKGLKLLPVDGPLLPLIRALRHGEVVGIAGDRDVTRSGLVVDFFGYPARLPDGHIRLAVKTGAPLVLGFSRRNPDHTYQAHFLPPYHPPDTGSVEERVQAGLRYVASEIEQAIRQYPEQWTVTVSIWADAPENEPV